MPTYARPQDCDPTWLISTAESHLVTTASWAAAHLRVPGPLPLLRIR